jgi:hypothetical protein
LLLSLAVQQKPGDLLDEQWHAISSVDDMLDKLRGY